MADPGQTSNFSVATMKREEEEAGVAGSEEEVGSPSAAPAKQHLKIDIDSIITRLVLVKNEPPGKRRVDLGEDELRGLCLKARKIFLSQPPLLCLDAPIKIIGDIHGQFGDLIRLLDAGGPPPESNYLFLGDYVDRGKQNIETIALLFAYKIKYPLNFFLLRGNHEAAAVNRVYGFFDECKRRYNVKIWKTFCDSFMCLPVAAIIADRIFCTHGGLSPDLKTQEDMQQIQNIKRPCKVPDSGVVCDLLWSDPAAGAKGWGPNDRGVSFNFGEQEVQDFLHRFDLDLVCRAHQVVEDGYQFFCDRKLVTVFSAPNYCGEFNNAAAMMVVDENMTCSFRIIKPLYAKMADTSKPSALPMGFVSDSGGAEEKPIQMDFRFEEKEDYLRRGE